MPTSSVTSSDLLAAAGLVIGYGHRHPDALAPSVRELTRHLR